LSARGVTLQRLEELASTDPLSGFLNRCSLEHLTVPPASAVALVDVDDFTDVNDARHRGRRPNP
jgi:GGDEF domain-containing protein